MPNEQVSPDLLNFLTPRELRTLEAFAEVFIEGEPEIISPREIALNIDRYLGQVRSNRVMSLRLSLILVEYVLPRISWWPFRRSFSRLRPFSRKKLLQKRLKNPRMPRLFRDFAKVRTLFHLGYYGDARVHESIGFVPVAERPRYQPDKLKTRHLPPLRLTQPEGNIMRCQVVVIGSGAGGAVAAYHLAAQGKAVILLEEGPYVPTAEIVNDEVAMIPRIYKEGGLQTTVDMDTSILQGKVLGGSTMLNNAICFRINDDQSSESNDILAAWRRQGATIDSVALEEAYGRVEQMIGVRPLLDTQAPDIPDIDGPNARKLLDGWQKLRAKEPSLGRFKSGLLRKNYVQCLGCGYCNFGCRYERKLSMVETYIPAAINRGARVVVDCHAKKLLHDGRFASGVQCEMGDGRTLKIQADAVVVAAGAIGSSVLLMKSGLGGPNVGRGFSFNAGLPVYGHFPEQINGFNGVQMAAYVDGGEFIIESLFNPPMGFAAPLPGWFGDHFNRMREYGRFACAGVLVGTESNGQVQRNGLLRQFLGPVQYRMTGRDLEKLRRGIALTCQIFFAAGADVVYPATFADCSLPAAQFAHRPEALHRFLAQKIQRPDDVLLGSAHPQGGNVMSEDTAVGVVDSQFRVHGTDNVYVCDASIFPSTVRINPQLTVMALADYFVQQGNL